MLLRRFGRTGVLADMDEAVTALAESVQVSAPDDPGRAGRLANLGGALLDRYERLAAPADIEQAITVTRDAIAAADADNPYRTLYLNSLSGALRARFGQSRNLGDLDEAVAVASEAVSQAPPEHPDRARYLLNLAESLRVTFEVTGEDGLAETAVDAFAQAAAPSQAPPSIRALAARGRGQAGYGGRTGAVPPWVHGGPCPRGALAAHLVGARRPAWRAAAACRRLPREDRRRHRSRPGGVLLHPYRPRAGVCPRAGHGGGTALHHAVRQLRDSLRAKPSLWAAYLHTGA